MKRVRGRWGGWSCGKMLQQWTKQLSLTVPPLRHGSSNSPKPGESLQVKRASRKRETETETGESAGPYLLYMDGRVLGSKVAIRVIWLPSPEKPFFLCYQSFCIEWLLDWLVGGKEAVKRASRGRRGDDVTATNGSPFLPVNGGWCEDNKCRRLLRRKRM